MQAGRLQADGLAVGGNPDNRILRIQVRGQGAEKQRCENRKVPHTRSIGWLHARTLENSREEDYEGTKRPAGMCGVSPKACGHSVSLGRAPPPAAFNFGSCRTSAVAHIRKAVPI